MTMSKTFEIPLGGDAVALVNKAQAAATTYAATFSGDISSGSFSGRGFDGSYTIIENMATVTITKKPFIVPWILVESKVRGFFT